MHATALLLSALVAVALSRPVKDPLHRCEHGSPVHTD